MRWKTYKKLSPKLKEEYNYRFKNHPVPNFRIYFNWAMVITMTTTLFLFMSYIILTDDTFIELTGEVTSILGSIGSLVQASFTILLIAALYDAGRLLVYSISKQRWLKKNNIKGEVIWKKVPFIRIL